MAFNDKIKVPLRPFPGVMGVAPATGEMLTTIPPRENGGNMDDPHMTEGTTIYFPVFVDGALFSIGDGHATQGMGEVCGTAIETPLRIVYEVEVLKGGRSIPEPEYESDDYYAVTAIGTTIDEAARKATGFMVDYLMAEHGLGQNDAYALCSLAGDLQIAEVVGHATYASSDAYAEIGIGDGVRRLKEFVQKEKATPNGRGLFLPKESNQHFSGSLSVSGIGKMVPNVIAFAVDGKENLRSDAPDDGGQTFDALRPTVNTCVGKAFRQ